MQSTKLNLLARNAGTDRRQQCVSVRLSSAEYARVSAWAIGARKKKGQLLREVALRATPALIPENNLVRWTAHAKTLSNLNQLCWHLNAGRLPGEIRPVLATLLGEVRAFRAELRGEEVRYGD